MFARPFARTMRSACLAIGAFALLCIGIAAAEEVLKLHGLTIPDRVAGLPHEEAPFDYEKTHPGLGHSVQFIRPGWRIDVYVYNARHDSIPDNPQSDLVKGQLEGARRDIFEMQQRGNYRDVEVTRNYAVERNGRTRFICSALTFHHNRTNADVDSYVCVSSWNNKFIKIRMTTARGGAATSADAQAFVDAWSDLLWPSI
jgi:hypothetical protein